MVRINQLPSLQLPFDEHYPPRSSESPGEGEWWRHEGFWDTSRDLLQLFKQVCSSQSEHSFLMYFFSTQIYLGL